jgi:hypothetical protein
MIRLGALLVPVMLLAQTSGASAGQPQPICIVPSVMDAMSRAIRQRDYYARIEPRLVFEQPAPPTNTVWCGVGVSTLDYNTYRAGGMPLWRCAQYMFSVRALSEGFVVRFLNQGPWLRAPR